MSVFPVRAGVFPAGTGRRSYHQIFPVRAGVFRLQAGR